MDPIEKIIADALDDAALFLEPHQVSCCNED